MVLIGEDGTAGLFLPMVLIRGNGMVCLFLTPQVTQHYMLYLQLQIQLFYRLRNTLAVIQLSNWNHLNIPTLYFDFVYVSV